jgi:hypothetical protein
LIRLAAFFLYNLISNAKLTISKLTENLIVLAG